MLNVKFRGKRVDNGEWVVGSFLDDTIHNRTLILTFSITGEIRENRVIPETVGQYIGLDDKKKVEIYEGDIIRSFDKQHYDIQEIVFNKGDFCGLSKRGNEERYELACTIVRDGSEVIGNVTDNSNLI